MNHPSEPSDANEQTDVSMPDDFPRDPFPSALPGAQAKFSARLIDGRYVVGLTKEERLGRFLYCSDLVEQLTAYTERKHREQKDGMTMAARLDKYDHDMRQKDWDLGGVEFDWIVKQLRSKFLGDQHSKHRVTA